MLSTMEEDIALKIMRTTIFSLVVPNKEPCSGYKIRMEYKDLEGEDIPFASYGFRTLDDFLINHPMLNALKIDNKWVFTAKLSEKSANIQQLVAGQKSKKKKKGKGGNFNRFGARSSYHGRSNATMGNGDVRKQSANSSFSRNNAMYRSFNVPSASSQPRKPAYVPPPRPDTSVFRSSISALTRGIFDPVRVARAQQPVRVNPLVPTVTGPLEGIRRLTESMKKLKGVALLTKLCQVYAQDHGVSFDAAELKRHFGTANLSEILMKHANDKIIVTPTPDGSIMLTDRQILEDHKKAAAEMEERKKRNLVIEPERKHCDVPGLRAMYDGLVEMLVFEYPNTIELSSISDCYEERTGVRVDPVQAYNKTWEELIKKTFAAKISLKRARVCLSDRHVKALKLDEKRDSPRRKMELITLADLGIIYCDGSSSQEDEEDDEDEEEDDDDNSSFMAGNGANASFSHAKWRDNRTSGYVSTCSSVADPFETLSTGTPTKCSAEEEEALQKSSGMDDLTDLFRTVKLCESKTGGLQITINSSGTTSSSPPNSTACSSGFRPDILSELNGARGATPGAKEATSGAWGATFGAREATAGARGATPGAKEATSGAWGATSGAWGATSGAREATAGATTAGVSSVPSSSTAAAAPITTTTTTHQQPPLVPSMSRETPIVTTSSQTSSTRSSTPTESSASIVTVVPMSARKPFTFMMNGYTPPATSSASASSIEEKAPVRFNPPELKLAAGGYGSFSFILDSSDCYAYKATYKEASMKIFGSVAGYTNSGVPKLCQVIRKAGPASVAPVTFEFVRIPKDLFEKKPDLKAFWAMEPTISFSCTYMIQPK